MPVDEVTAIRAERIATSISRKSSPYRLDAIFYAALLLYYSYLIATYIE